MKKESIKLKLLKPTSKLIADKKALVFKDDVCEVPKVTKDIQFFIDRKYIKIIKEEREDG